MSLERRSAAVGRATLLFLGASVSQWPAIRFARRAGYRIVACDGDPDAVAFSDVDVPLAVDFTDVETVGELAARHGVEAVLAVCTDRAVVPAAEVAKRLGLPGIPTAVAQAMTDKAAMRDRLAAAGLRQPPHEVLGPGDGASVVRFPAVLKPVDSGGQRGVFLVDSPAALRRLLPEALAFSRVGRAILEEYLEGSELNAIVVVRGSTPTVVTLSDRLRPPGPGFGVGWIHRFPSTLPAAVVDEARAVAEAAVRAFGVRDAIVFPQLLATADGVIVVEIAARIAAGQMADLVRHATGIELYDVAIRQALGEPVADELVTPAGERPVAIRFLTASPGLLPVGVVRSIHGLESVRASPGVLDAGLYFDVGATIRPVQVDADRSGYVIATGATADEALEHANDGGRLLRVETSEPAPARSTPPRRLPRRARLGAVLVAALIAGTLGAFFLAEGAKLQRPLVTGTRIEAAFSPTCACPHDVSRIAFRLMRRTPVVVRIVKRSGVAVATLFASSHPKLGLLHLTWLGRAANHRPEPDGVYYPEVVFPSLARTLRLPSPITLDTLRPRILRASARTGSRTVVRFVFSEPAHAELFAGSRRVVLSRDAATHGELVWRSAPAALTLVAVDAIGNRSVPVRLRR